jgi:hypothetical protein
MSEQWWALVGVVVGGILGGGAQIVAGTIQEGRRHEQWLREQRTDVYRQFLTEWHRRQSSLLDYVYDEGQHGEPNEDYLVLLFDRVDEVEVFGSPEAIAAAAIAAQNLMAFWNSNKATRDVKLEKANASLNAYREVIRHDLGVT